VIPEGRLRAISDVCAERNAWLVVDNTYDAFVYGVKHSLVEGPHVVNIFSFSKAYGLMGWRVGYLAYDPSIGPQMLKAQDTVAICASQCSQKAALAALEADVDGRWTGPRIAALADALGEPIPFGACDLSRPLAAPENGEVRALAPDLDVVLLSRTLSEVPDRGWTPFLRELWATLKGGAIVFVKDEQDVEDDAVDLLGGDAWSVPGVRGVFLRVD